MSDSPREKPVLILGAGINGCAVARELVLNQIPVVLVDQADIATGATAKSSRLIHGGLRYLEYGDFRLVAESLHERERLLQLAPQFVRPLKLYIPVSQRWGGLAASTMRFLGLSRWGPGRWIASRLPTHAGRGLLIVRMGLSFYDRIARSSLLPGHWVQRVGEKGVPAVDVQKFHWVCGYYDAQMTLPERFVIALLEDAQRAAEKSGTTFAVRTYHQVRRREQMVDILPADGHVVEQSFVPSAIINATGAWGDRTLEALHVNTEQLLGGTKGSHFITNHAALRQALGDGGVYAEADDGRLVFILPFAQSVLVGTTDERFSGPPDRAVASEEELEYLLGMVRDVFPQISLGREDVVLHYSGVRPLPFVSEGRTGAIPRGHWIHSQLSSGILVQTLIGGKLTTCRAFAEEVADRILTDLSVPRRCQTRERPVPGGTDFPVHPHEWCAAVATESGLTTEQVEAVFALVGTEARPLLSTVRAPGPSPSVPGTNLPVCFVDHVLAHEWVQTLGDLIERRLGLVFA
ncbi:MAG: glycerol-3-phosphate dehydrogenase/oxidase, partial [Planctomycetaceae bacterium]|nr:glycerol-3-phosphate dehydrogenase/oxidase [Planctomycetaceae bacterium]